MADSATTETNTELGRQIVEDAKRYVLYSWSVQDAINPIAVERAEGRYFYDYDGKRYLDFASQLVNVSIGHSHPKVIQAIKDQADKLLHMKIDIGEAQPRTIVAGIAEAYKPEQMVGRKVVIVANLQPRKLRGIESNGMIVAASLDGGKPILAGFLEDVPVGARLK